VVRFQTAANVFFYASELNRPRPRLAMHTYDPGAFLRAERTVTVVHASHRGNWNAEPGALGVFRAYLAAEHGVETRLIDHPLGRLGAVDPLPDLVVVNGTAAYEFDADERQALLRYVGAGGTVLFETPGGDGAFTRSAEVMATRLFDAPVRSLLRQPVISGRGVADASDLSRVDYRPYSFEVFGSRETTPRLRGILLDGTARVLFSREDISHGLLDQPCWGICGYAPESARRLLANIVRCATAEEPAP
jgi:hypothetical protein